MCGIAGLANFSGDGVDLADLKLMSSALIHRGPDGDGFHIDGAVGFAHRRLAIIDPEGGAQPMLNEERSVAVTYNGEIYNFKEIRRELSREFHFRTQSDTEVLLRSFEKWGIACLGRFRGMFACGIYDSRTGELYLIRDRVGVKPLYYSCHGDRFAFASELAALLELPWLPREIDRDALRDYLRYTNVPTPATIYQNIRKLAPGYYLRVDCHSGAVEPHRYWMLAPELVEQKEDEACERLNAELDEVFRIYVRSDVPFGCFLSGGVDSSLVTALTARHVEPRVQTFTVGFQERAVSELPFAAEVSNTVGTDHTEKIVSPQLALDLLSTMSRHFGEPFADSSAVPTFYVSQETSRRVKMVLSGDGGDELFAGYPSYLRTFREAGDPLGAAKRALFAMLANWMPLARVRRRADFLALGHGGKHAVQREMFNAAELCQLLGNDQFPDEEEELESAGSDGDPVTSLQARDFGTYLVDDILTKVDRMSMANSLEVRVPLLDHRIVELAFQLPMEFKIRKRAFGRVTSKYLLKKSANRFFPEPFLERPKMGFGIPIVDWCRGPLRPLLRQNLLNPSAPIFEWVDSRFTIELIEALERGERSLAGKAWCLLMLSIWIDEIHRR